MNSSSLLLMVITTVESERDATEIAKSLVKQSLAACVQIHGPVTSHYQWAEKLECAQEYRVTIKTTETAWSRLKEKLAKMHPYDEPQIVAIKIDESTPGYEAWVADQTG